MTAWIGFICWSTSVTHCESLISFSTVVHRRQEGLDVVLVIDHISFNPDQRFPYDRALAGVLRISSKYIIDEVREKAAKELLSIWPTSIRDMGEQAIPRVLFDCT